MNVALAIALLLLSTGCSGPREDELVVFAASSLRDPFTVLGADFERAHPGVRVTFSFAGTQRLRTQIEHGATPDVFAAADPRHMDALERAGRISSPVVFARNEPVVIVAPGSPLRTFADLPDARRIVVGAPEVPIGRYTERVLARASDVLGPDFRARVMAQVASRELNVRQVRAKVVLGEADAAVVYRTDARSTALRVVAIPPEINVRASYPIALVEGARDSALARGWVELVRSEAGQRRLREAGFLGPERAPR